MHAAVAYAEYTMYTTYYTIIIVDRWPSLRSTSADALVKSEKYCPSATRFYEPCLSSRY